MGELKDLQKAVVNFRDDRDWRQFHTPKNLAQALASEVGELNDLYLWSRAGDLNRVEQEMADILIYLLSLADVLRVDLDFAVRYKLKINANKYPVKYCKGSDLKAGAIT
jgi:NTP pyrophosphatase (non-canonical NTP hydrolase)